MKCVTFIRFIRLRYRQARKLTKLKTENHQRETTKFIKTLLFIIYLIPEATNKIFLSLFSLFYISFYNELSGVYSFTVE